MPWLHLYRSKNNSNNNYKNEKKVDFKNCQKHVYQKAKQSMKTTGGGKMFCP